LFFHHSFVFSGSCRENDKSNDDSIQIHLYELDGIICWRWWFII